MAFCDYHPCDLCGDAKTFYDADMDYGHDVNGVLVYGGWQEGKFRVGGHRAYALCPKCSETHEIVIQPKL